MTTVMRGLAPHCRPPLNRTALYRKPDSGQPTQSTVGKDDALTPNQRPRSVTLPQPLQPHVGHCRVVGWTAVNIVTCRGVMRDTSKHRS